MKKQTALQKEYVKQVRRINRFLKSAYYRGFYLKAPDDFVESIPKRATRKNIDKLKYLTPSRIYAKMEYTLPTGEIVSGTKGMSYNRAVAQLKSAKSETDYLNRLGNIFKKYRVAEQEIQGASYTPDEPLDVGSAGFTEEEVNEVAYYNFEEEVNFGFPANLAEAIIDAVERVVARTSKADVGYAIRNIPYNIQYYLAIYPNSDEAIYQYCATLVKYLPIEKNDAEKLEREFDATST